MVRLAIGSARMVKRSTTLHEDTRRQLAGSKRVRRGRSRPEDRGRDRAIVGEQVAVGD
jgi:hypothetical protein